MKYPARKFNQQSYNESDNWARKVFILYLINHDFYIINDKETYDVDIIAKKDNIVYRFELEVKRKYPWTSINDYHFDTVSFLGRKLRLHKKEPFIYVIICRETKCAISLRSEDIYLDKYAVTCNINTIHRQGLDKFYRVPKELCKFFNLENYEKNNNS